MSLLISAALTCILTLSGQAPSAQERVKTPAVKLSEKTKTPEQLVPRARLFLIKPKGYVHAGAYSVPGYYTLIIFSASWCAPCGKLREQALGWLKRYPNLVIVDLDIGSNSESGLSTESSAILADLGNDVALPAALLFSPFGIYINTSNGQRLAPAVSGYESITTRIAGLSKRKYQIAVEMPEKSVLNNLRMLEGAKLHYAYSSFPPNPEQSGEKTRGPQRTKKKSSKHDKHKTVTPKPKEEASPSKN